MANIAWQVFEMYVLEWKCLNFKLYFIEMSSEELNEHT